MQIVILHSVSERQSKNKGCQFRRLKKAPQINWLTVPWAIWKRTSAHSHPHVYQSWKFGLNRSSMFWDNRPDVPIFGFFFTQVQKWAKVSPELLTKPQQICTRCSHIQCASKLPIVVSIFLFYIGTAAPARQWRLVGVKRRFCDFNWLL